MAFHFRQAICNEVYEKRPFAETCRSIKQAGYDGIEIAPFTLDEYPASISPARRREYASIMDSEGLGFVGLHWLMVSPRGLHVTTPDTAVREKSWRHIRDLVDLCADLAVKQTDPGIMVFGSPKQRGSTGGISRAQAMEHYARGLASVADQAASRGVTILAEALPSADCDVMNTIAESAGIVAGIGSPAIRTMFDTHNAADEVHPHDAIVDRYFDVIRHIHINEMDGRYPGTGDYDFKPLFEVLNRKDYQGWISLEVFDFKPDADTIASESLRNIRSVIERLES